jgi:hypothetical protein
MSCPGSPMSHTFQSLWHLWESLRYHKSPQWCQWCLCSCMLFNSALQVFSLLVTFEHVTCNHCSKQKWFGSHMCSILSRILKNCSSYGVEPATEDFRFTRAGFFKTIILLQNIIFFVDRLASLRPWHQCCWRTPSTRNRRTGWNAQRRVLVLHAGGIEFCFFSPGYIFLDSLYRVVALQTRCLDNPKIQISAFLKHVKVSHTLSEYILICIYIYKWIMPNREMFAVFLFFLQTEQGCQGPLSSVG